MRSLDRTRRDAHQPETLVADDQPDALEAPLLEVEQEVAPAFPVLPGCLGYAMEIPVSFPVDPVGYQHAHVPGRAAPGALQADPVEMGAVVLPFD